ncbi:MAG: response regulator [Chitinophagaceae bacterium]|jgi:two-component system nitrate/nitrite response regulator NarL
MIRIVLADDHQLFTEGLRALFENDPDVYITAIYHRGAYLLNEIERIKADVLLLDLKMGEPDGLSILNQLAKQNLDLKTIMLSTYSDQFTMLECKQRGARGYLLKNTSKEELKAAINKVMNNETAFEHLNNAPETDEEKFNYCHEKYKLTRREWEVLMLIKKQYTNQMISNSLHLSIYTVETHRKNLMQKLKLKNPVSLFQFIQLHEL